MADRIVLASPERSECDEYYFLYIDRVPTGDVLGLLEGQLERTAEFLLGLDPGRWDYRYASGKWSVKEVVGHVIDVERTFSYRAMCGARNDPADLPSFEQEPYAENSRYGVRPIAETDRLARALAANVKHGGLGVVSEPNPTDPGAPRSTSRAGRAIFRAKLGGGGMAIEEFTGGDRAIPSFLSTAGVPLDENQALVRRVALRLE